MVDKYKKSDFGRCPRVYCEGQPLLPCGQDDSPGKKPVKLYCARCEDIYSPKSSRHSSIDGAYFGTSFHNILFQVYPALIPTKSRRRHEPKIFGFKVHAAAALGRWQDEERRDMRERLAAAGPAPSNAAANDSTTSSTQQHSATTQAGAVAAPKMFLEDEISDDGMADRAAQLAEEANNNADNDEEAIDAIDDDEEDEEAMKDEGQEENMGQVRARAVQAAVARAGQLQG